MSNSIDPDETAHLDLCCLQKPIIIACSSERVKCIVYFVDTISGISSHQMYLEHMCCLSEPGTGNTTAELSSFETRRGNGSR